MGMKCQTIASGQLFEYGVQPLSCPASSLIARSCPGLCYVGTSVGTKPIPNESEVITSHVFRFFQMFTPPSFFNLNPLSVSALSLSGKDQRGSMMAPGTF